jgi:hypothetical protein
VVDAHDEQLGADVVGNARTAPEAVDVDPVGDLDDPGDVMADQHHRYPGVEGP